MEWGIIVVAVFFALVAYAIIQETRAQMHWRGLVAKGDVDAIKQLLAGEIERWRSDRVPKDVPALLWHGVQTVEIIAVGATGARVNCSAEGEYALVDGQRAETSSPLAEGMKTTKKLADMLLYDVPNLRLDHVQIDVYTSFRDEGGHASARCILSSLVRRGDVEDLDWEATSATEFAEIVGARFVADGPGALRPTEPLPWSDPIENEVI